MVHEDRQLKFNSQSRLKPMNVIAFLLLVLATPVFGQLKWENPEQTVTASPQDKVLVTKFRFTNVGNTPLKITDVRVYDCSFGKKGVRARRIRGD
jgi:hypothetical protein